MKFLSHDGLMKFWDKIKGYVDDNFVEKITIIDDWHSIKNSGFYKSFANKVINSPNNEFYWYGFSVYHDINHISLFICDMTSGSNDWYTCKKNGVDSWTNWEKIKENNFVKSLRKTTSFYKPGWYRIATRTDPETIMMRGTTPSCMILSLCSWFNSDNNHEITLMVGEAYEKMSFSVINQTCNNKIFSKLRVVCKDRIKYLDVYYPAIYDNGITIEINPLNHYFGEWNLVENPEWVSEEMILPEGYNQIGDIYTIPDTDEYGVGIKVVDSLPSTQIPNTMYFVKKS